MKEPHFKNYMQTSSPDIICLNETQVNKNTISNTNSNKNFKEATRGYHYFWNLATNKKGYSGTSIFTKEKPISVRYDIGGPQNDKEGRIMTAEFDKFILVSSHMPNSG